MLIQWFLAKHKIYSSDMTVCDLSYLPNSKGQRSSRMDELKAKSPTGLKTISTDAFHQCFSNWNVLGYKCINHKRTILKEMVDKHWRLSKYCSRKSVLLNLLCVIYPLWDLRPYKEFITFKAILWVIFWNHLQDLIPVINNLFFDAVHFYQFLNLRAH